MTDENNYLKEFSKAQLITIIEGYREQVADYVRELEELKKSSEKEYLERVKYETQVINFVGVLSWHVESKKKDTEAIKNLNRQCEQLMEALDRSRYERNDLQRRYDLLKVSDSELSGTVAEMLDFLEKERED